MGKTDTFGARLRRLRQGTGKSAAEFAAQIGLTTDAELKLESGKRGRSHARLPVIARALGCRIDDLFPEMDEPDAETPDELRRKMLHQKIYMTPPPPEMMEAYKALRSMSRWWSINQFDAECPLCKARIGVAVVRTGADSVDCQCAVCGADKAAIYRAVGMERWLDEAKEGQR